MVNLLATRPAVRHLSLLPARRYAQTNDEQEEMKEALQLNGSVQTREKEVLEIKVKTIRNQILTRQKWCIRLLLISDLLRLALAISFYFSFQSFLEMANAVSRGSESCLSQSNYGFQMLKEVSSNRLSRSSTSFPVLFFFHLLLLIIDWKWRRP